MRRPKEWWSSSLIFGFLATALYMLLQAVNQAVDLALHMRGSGEE